MNWRMNKNKLKILDKHKQQHRGDLIQKKIALLNQKMIR